jgi:signal transduction histidine kinase
MTDKMNDIIWTSHAENDSMKKILKRLFDYARPLCAARNIRFISDIESVPEDAIIEPAVRNHIYLFSKEAINNAVKHAGADEIVYSAGFVDGNCLVRIADNGMGFDTGLQYEGNGIKNMRVRAGEMGLALTIISSPGEGTIITLKMKSND